LINANNFPFSIFIYLRSQQQVLTVADLSIGLEKSESQIKKRFGLADDSKLSLLEFIRVMTNENSVIDSHRENGNDSSMDDKIAKRMAQPAEDLDQELGFNSNLNQTTVDIYSDRTQVEPVQTPSKEQEPVSSVKTEVPIRVENSRADEQPEPEQIRPSEAAVSVPTEEEKIPNSVPVPQQNGHVESEKSVVQAPPIEKTVTIESAVGVVESAHISSAKGNNNNIEVTPAEATPAPQPQVKQSPQARKLKAELADPEREQLNFNLFILIYFH
jgi:hypothetical protein